MYYETITYEFMVYKVALRQNEIIRFEIYSMNSCYRSVVKLMNLYALVAAQPGFASTLLYRYRV